MKKTLSVMLAVLIMATLCSVMAFSASADTVIPVKRLTYTATDLKLANDNMSEQDAIAACQARLGSELSTYAIYSKPTDGKYNYLSCSANTGWYKAGTDTLENIKAKATIYGVMFVGTFKEVCQPVDYMNEVKAAGADYSTFNFGDKDYHVCTQDELAYVQNEVNERYEGQANIVCLELFYNEKSNEIMVMQFEKMYADKDCIAMCYSGKCENFADFVTSQAQYAYTSAKYVVAEVISFDMLEGKNQTVDLSKVDSANFRSEGEFDHFAGFMIDGKFVDASNYTAKSGSTIVEVKKSYLNTLANGTHIVAIVSEEGIATTQFTLTGSNVVAASKTTSPKTGETINDTLLVIFMVISFIGAIALVCEKKIAE